MTKVACQKHFSREFSLKNYTAIIKSITRKTLQKGYEKRMFADPQFKVIWILFFLFLVFFEIWIKIGWDKKM